MAVGPESEPIDLSAITMPPRWRIVEWLRGSFGYGQARCVREDGVRALATFSLAPRMPLARVVASLALSARGVVPVVDAQLAGDYAVLFEAEPPGEPLSSATAPFAHDLALAVFRTLLAIAADAASRGEVLLGLRPELVYLDRGTVVSVVPRAERFAMSAPESRDLSPTSPFPSIYCAPESVQVMAPTPAYDVFACCALLLFLLTGKQPFPGDGILAQLTAILTGPPALPATLDSRIAQLVRAGLDPDPAKRPTARELMNALALS